MVLPQKPKVQKLGQVVQRMNGFVMSPFHILRVTSSTLERAVELWEKSRAGIEACVAVCAFQEVGDPPYVVVTVNDHYNELANFGISVFKPSDLRRGPSSYVQPHSQALDSGDLNIC
jgi:hypothetical protein